MQKEVTALDLIKDFFFHGWKLNISYAVATEVVRGRGSLMHSTAWRSLGQELCSAKVKGG